MPPVWNDQCFTNCDALPGEMVVSFVAALRCVLPKNVGQSAVCTACTFVFVVLCANVDVMGSVKTPSSDVTKTKSCIERRIGGKGTRKGMPLPYNGNVWEADLCMGGASPEPHSGNDKGSGCPCPKPMNVASVLKQMCFLLCNAVFLTVPFTSIDKHFTESA